MQITVSGSLSEIKDQLQELLDSFTGAGVSITEEAVSTPKKKTATKKKAVAKEKEEVEETAPESESITLADLQKRVSGAVKANPELKTDVKAILNSLNASRLSELDESQFNEFAAKLSEIGVD